MKRESGAARIFFYNWPVYAATWAMAGLLLGLGPHLPTPAARLAALFGYGAILWSLASLAVSYYLYDRSMLTGAGWIRQLLPAGTQRWALVHAGLDAELDLDAAMPGQCVARLDVFDPTSMTAPSIRRARQRTPQSTPAATCTPVSLALADAACDAVVVAFTAHEIRDPAARQRFFAELRRCLRPGGRALLVEHLRDVANFLAFGPGFLHFLPRRTWLQESAHAGLSVAAERRITPFVMAMALERSE